MRPDQQCVSEKAGYTEFAQENERFICCVTANYCNSMTSHLDRKYLVDHLFVDLVQNCALQWECVGDLQLSVVCGQHHSLISQTHLSVEPKGRGVRGSVFMSKNSDLM